MKSSMKSPLKFMGLALTLAAQAFAVQPGLLLGMGRIHQSLRKADPANPVFLMGLSLSQEIGFAEIFADAALGRIHPAADDRDNSWKAMSTANLGMRAGVPVSTFPFRAGIAGGMNWQAYGHDEAYGDAVGADVRRHFVPFGGIFLAWRHRIYGEWHVYPINSPDLPWTVRLGIQPLAFFR
jgi:hypothetical protein